MVIKCITFDKEAQNNLPKEVKDKMKADRKNAESKQLKRSNKLKTEIMRYFGIYQHIINKRGNPLNLLIAKATGENENSAIENYLSEEVKPDDIDFKKGYLKAVETLKEHFDKDDNLTISKNKERLGVWV